MIQTLSERHADFFDQVYAVVRLIPFGRATSYGAIANYLGVKKSARMVGWAMHGAHKAGDVPAHRVVNRNGYLTGSIHFSGPNEMAELLAREGIEVADGRITDFKKVYWDPNVELEIN
jgi:methylated-DNA-protein-cysteine methyltransferase-like protein